MVHSTSVRRVTGHARPSCKPGLEYGANANDDEREAECHRRCENKCLVERHFVLLTLGSLKRHAPPPLDALDIGYFVQNKATAL